MLNRRAAPARHAIGSGVVRCVASGCAEALPVTRCSVRGLMPIRTVWPRRVSLSGGRVPRQGESVVVWASSGSHDSSVCTDGDDVAGRHEVRGGQLAATDRGGQPLVSVSLAPVVSCVRLRRACRSRHRARVGDPSAFAVGVVVVLVNPPDGRCRGHPDLLMASVGPEMELGRGGWLSRREQAWSAARPHLRCTGDCTQTRRDRRCWRDLPAWRCELGCDG